jgi:TctA family transporter
MGMITEFRRHIVPAVIKPMRVVWNQSIAFLFLALTVIGAFMVYREYQRREAMDALLALVMGGLFVGLMAFYGLSSLWKARKISRS